MLSPETTSGSSNSFYRAVLVIILAIFLFDIQGVLIKYMGQQFPVTQITLFRNLFGLLPCLLVLLLLPGWNHPRHWRIRQWRLALGRGLLLIAAQLCFYLSLIRMELATATTLAFAGPLFVTTLSVPLLGHRVGGWRIAAVVLGFAGVVLVVRPQGDFFTPLALLPVCAAFFYALTSISSRFFDQEIPTALINLYSSAGTLVASGIVVLISADWVAMSSPSDWLGFVAMGSAGGFAVLLLISAYRMTEPSNLSPFEYFGIPFSFVLGWIVFDEAPFDRLLPGVFLIVAAGLLILYREHLAREKNT